jgi:LysR family transcriptional regulator of beta-lactamase
MHAVLEQFEGGLHRQVVTVAVVGTFAVGWLLPRLPAFQRAHPAIDLRLMTNNNRVDLAAEGLDWAIRFGDGAWHGTEARALIAPPLSPACAPAIARRLRTPADLARETLLRSYRPDEWTRWFAAARVAPPLARGTIFDSSITLADAAAQGAGVALLPTALFGEALRSERLVQPFDMGVTLGGYWLTRLKSRPESDAMRTFADWLQARVREEDAGLRTPAGPAA